MAINDFSLQKKFENLLFLSCGKLAKQDKHTRKYLKRLAADAVRAYRFGQADAQAGKPAAKESEIKELKDPSELVRASVQFAHSMYLVGYESESGVK